MATESTARPKDLKAVERKLSGTRPRAERESRRVAHEIPPPPPGPSDLEAAAEASIDFEAHDTIPAPPWLDDENP
jgi:hypothetical protein